MKRLVPSPVSVFAICLLLGFLVNSGRCAETIEAVTYSPHAAFPSCLMNMGPTGARAWMRGYHFVVVEIDFFSPAAGKLEPADVVIAADGKTFGPQHDPRMTLGNAIGLAEARGKPLVLTVLRDGKKKRIKIDLPPTGDYAATWPAGCEKSRGILDDACQSLLNVQMPNGQIITDGNMGTALGGLLMLANPDPRFLDGARRAAYQVAEQEYKFTAVCNNWPMAYGGILLAEYYLATGDAAVLSRLQDMVGIMVRGQMRSGGWGHTSPGGAYGTLNQIGVVCAIMLTLADECGVDVPQDSYAKALAFFARYAEIGAVPYGDHLPYVNAFDANGRSASGAILMQLAGRDHEATAFSESVAASYFEREEGHTGGFFSMTWGPLAAAMCGPEKLQRFMDYQKWHYNLLRTWQGELIMLPYQEALTRFDSSSYIDFGGDFTTGGMGLAFALPYQRLRIMGAPGGVFSASAELEGKLLQARTHWLAKAWGDCDAILDELKAAELSSETDRRMLAQLIAARAYRRAAATRLLSELESNLDNRAAYRATRQYEALKKSLGSELDERFVKMDERMEGAARAIESGEKMFEAWRELKGLSFQGWVPYGPRAKDLIQGVPPLRVPVWEPLSPVSGVAERSWRTLHLAEGEEAPKQWMTPAFDDSDWHERENILTAGELLAEGLETNKTGLAAARPLARTVFHVDDPKGDALRVRLQTVRPATTQVYLNGELIVDAVRGQRGGYAVIALDASVFSLLKKGRNVLAVSSTKQGTGGNHLDVGLEICRAAYEMRSRGIIRAERLVVDGGKHVDNTLRVREQKDRVKKAHQDACNAKEIPELVSMLGVSIAAQRHIAEQALASKGIAGIAAAAEALDDEDWKVRSAACNVFAATAAKHKAAPEGDEMKAAAQHVAKLTALLNDEHDWVQVRAAAALRNMGEPARESLPVLMALVTDDDEWVRTEALAAVEGLAADDATKLDAAMAALKLPGTAFRSTRIAHRIVKDQPAEGEDGRLEAVAATLRNPPEGSGGRNLIALLDYAVELDPEGKVLIPIFIDAAADKMNYARQQANPRGKVIDLLVAYGDKAKGVIPVLQAILKSDERFEKLQHDKAREALEAFGVPVEEKE